MVRDEECQRPGIAENGKGSTLRQLDSCPTTPARRATYLSFLVNFPSYFSLRSFTMSTSYDKVVKLACKPKAAPPKPKVRPSHIRGTVCILTPAIRSTSTLSLLLPGLKTARSTMFARLSRRASESPT